MISKSVMNDIKYFIIDEEAEKRELEKYANFTYLFDIWLKNMEKGKNVSSYFERNGYKKIVVYGMGMIGKHIVEQLKDTNIQVLYTIERGVISASGKVYTSTEIDKLEEKPDVIVVTPLMEYVEIKEMLFNKYKCDIVSAEEVILSV